MIRARGLAVGYGGEEILRGLDFEVGRGEVFLILGPSGCGKSTLLRCLIGLHMPSAGILEVEPGCGGGFGREAPRFGVLFQSGALFGSMTLGQNVALPLERWTQLDRGTVEEIVRWKLAVVGLDGFENDLPSEVSGGMRKRAAIARALALEPRVLYLDEPSAGLDPVSAAELDELVLTLNRSMGVTIVAVTHELASIHAIGTRCILLDREAGGIVANGSPAELAALDAPPAVVRFFRRLPPATVR